MRYDELEFIEYRLRQVGVRRISVNTEMTLGVETARYSIEVAVTTYEQTRKELDKELSTMIESTWKIGEILDYFDEKWAEIVEFLNEKVMTGGELI
ncbi:MAG TPA: hypothetical protein VFG45_09825 [Candidatus Nitrosocosmicus sp.]|nr:hypothetical protein [Candidatus Nitrosocosmicus sp.]